METGELTVMLESDAALVPPLTRRRALTSTMFDFEISPLGQFG